MRRCLLTLFCFAALAAWADAQGPAPTLTAEQRARLFKSNRMLLENMVNHGIAMAEADNPLQRADECRKTASTLARSLGRAAEDQDPERVVELAGLFGEVIRDGLVPNLDAAQANIAPGDPREAQLQKLRERTAEEIDGLKLPADGKAGANQKARDALAALQALKSKLVKNDQ
jgi:hypothetical protein